MENNQLQPAQPSFNGTLAVQKVNTARLSKSLSDCTDEEIKQVLRYGIVLIGIPEDKHGDDVSKMILIDFLRKTHAVVKIDELKLAFDFAVEKRSKVKLEIYPGEIISARYVSDILTAYLLYKKELLRFTPKDEVKMNNVQRTNVIYSLLSKETLDFLNEMGKKKERSGNESNGANLPYYDVHQRWFRQFDKLHLKYEHDEKDPVTGRQLSGRWIKRYGKPHNVEGYFNKKVSQLQMSKNRKSGLCYDCGAKDIYKRKVCKKCFTSHSL